MIINNLKKPIFLIIFIILYPIFPFHLLNVVNYHFKTLISELRVILSILFVEILAYPVKEIEIQVEIRYIKGVLHHDLKNILRLFKYQVQLLVALIKVQQDLLALELIRVLHHTVPHGEHFYILNNRVQLRLCLQLLLAVILVELDYFGEEVEDELIGYRKKSHYFVYFPLQQVIFCLFIVN